MKITRDNYESYFLDYLEGSLEDSLVNEFLEFTNKHPDLRLELQNFDKTIQIPEESLTVDKTRLYRISSGDNEAYNHQLVAWLEGDLSETEATSLTNSAQSNPSLLADMEVMRKTRLAPDQEVVFRHKSRLHRKVLPGNFMRWGSSAAALILMALLIKSLLPDSETAPYTLSPLPLVNESLVESILPESLENVPEKVAQFQTNASIHSVLLPEPSIDSESKVIVYEEAPPPLPVRKGLLALQEEKQLLAGINPVHPPATEPDELYLTERLLDKTGLDDFSLNKMLRAGLSIASELSNDRFSYAVNSEGELTTLAIDTRFFGFRVAKDRVP